jgi:hypothetical protein
VDTSVATVLAVVSSFSLDSMRDSATSLADSLAGILLSQPTLCAAVDQVREASQPDSQPF